MRKVTRVAHDDEVRSLITPVGLGEGVPEKKHEQVALPVGTVTLILADAEGSTRLWETDPDSVAPATRSHDRIVDEAIGRNGGVRPQEQGEGDSFVAAFSRPSDALAAALEIQRSLHREGSPMRLRLALHTGEVQLRNESNYIGVAINRTARIRSTGHGEQILLSQVTHDLVADRLPDGVTFKDLGVHRLKDLSRPERIYQVLHPDLPHEFPPLRSLDCLPNNLPVQRTSFIGRTRELEELLSLLDETRLLTLSGSGGAGKSRLAVQLGAEVLDRFEDGVWFVALATVQDDAGVAKHAATAVGLGETQTELLPKFIGSKKMLVILDNAEHVLDATGNLSAALLDACPELRIVVTSRAPLAIEGETTYRVPSLTLPGEDARVPIGSLTGYEAVQLFVDRATKARPNFKLDPQNAGTVAEICRRLDGIPLALELAAARIRVLSPPQILDGLADRFRLLTGSTRAVMPRQQTLRASVDWSHDLLDETERSVFRRLAVFTAPFDLDAAEAVAASEELPSLQVLDVLTQLVDKSLVVVVEGETTTRYSMLETIREYALERLNDSGEKREVLERHRDHYLGWTESTYDLLYSEWDDPDANLAEILHLSQWQNAESALEWALDESDGATALRFLAAGLGGAYWAGRDWRRHFERAVEMASEPSVDKARAYGKAGELSLVNTAWRDSASQAFEGLEMLRSFPEEETGKYLAAALLSAGAIAGVLADQAKARPLTEEAVEAAERYGDPYWRIEAEQQLGYIRTIGGEVDDGLAQLRDVLDKARSSKNMYLLSMALFGNGLANSLAGRREEALPYYEEAVPLIRRYRPEKLYLQFALDHIGGILVELDRAGEARAYLEEALEVSRDYDLEGEGNYWNILLRLARVDELDGSIDRARARLSQVVEGTKADPSTRSQALAALGHLEVRQGETGSAEALFTQALAEARQFEPKRDLTGTMAPQPILVPVLGFVDLAVPINPARAARLSGFTEAWIEENELRLGRQRQRLRVEHLDTLKDTLGSHRLDAELRGGRALSMEDAVSYALGEAATPVSRALLASDLVEKSLRGEGAVSQAVSDEIDALGAPELSIPRTIVTVGRAMNLVSSDPVEAEQLVHSVLDAIVSVDDPALSAACFLLLAQIASRQESYEESARLLGAALALREQPEVEPAAWIEAARDAMEAEAFGSAVEEGKGMSAREAAAYASRGRGKRSRPSAGWQSLTPTEVRVAELAAEGLTNPQIAERLFVSRRTVQSHLYNIFTKLGVQNRTELATEVVKRRANSAPG